MTRSMRLSAVAVLAGWLSSAGHADVFHLMIGLDAGLWPGEERLVPPSDAGCCESSFFDDDRLAGNAPLGPPVEYIGSGTPMYAPNQFGSLSFMFRRGTLPAGGGMWFPWQGVDFLGGPLLDLDGDLGDGSRSLIPVFGRTAVEIPASSGIIALEFDQDARTVLLSGFDATGNNEGGFGIGAGIATTVNTMAGTEPDGTQTGPINPGVDTRQGTLLPFVGSSGLLTGVYRIENLGFEFWQDTLLAESGTASTLGTFQFLGTFRGWLIDRDPETREFPVLAGEGLGPALWPMVDTSGLGRTFMTAHGLAGGTATILRGIPGVDDFTVPGNGGTGPTELGPYFDEVLLPAVHPLSDRFVYLEAAGFGINNSGDPLYLDTVSYDVVLVAAQAPLADGDRDGDGDVDLWDFARFQACFTGQGAAAVPPGCEVFDFDYDGDVDLTDFAGFAQVLGGPA